MTMPLYLLRHATDLPSVHGMIAGCLAARLSVDLLHLASGGAGLGHFDCAQHVQAGGTLEPNGLFWAEWAAGPGAAVGPALQPMAILRRPGAAVVAANPAIPAEAAAAARLVTLAEAAGRPLIDLSVTEEAGIYRLQAPAGSGLDGLSWRRDRFGRPVMADAPPIPTGPMPRILLIGDPVTLIQAAPAPLAALGDAAEALGLQPDIRILDPRDADQDALAAAVAGTDGIVLPGGSDMEQVAGQILVAEAALDLGIPVLGLCLGMQCMTTAFARRTAGLPEANMEEAAPDAPLHLFRRLHAHEHPARHRLGADHMAVRQGTMLDTILGQSGAADMRLNHRYVLDPTLVPQLEAAGLQVTATQSDHDLVDAIALPGHRFYLGLQGHPEQLSRRNAPYPVFTAFLHAAAAADPS